MSALRHAQDTLLAALLGHPARPPARAAAEALADLTDVRSHRGLSIYRANGHALAERCLASVYPVVQALVGEETHRALARHLWHAHPPSGGDAGVWGEPLAALIDTLDGLAELPYLSDVARVEWALHRAERAANATVDGASFARLTSHDPNALVWRLSPGAALMPSAWPVVSLIEAHRGGGLSLAAAGERVAARQPETALVHRRGWRAAVRPAPPAEVALLTTGIPLGRALDAALAADPHFDFNPWLHGAVHDGLITGIDLFPPTDPESP